MCVYICCHLISKISRMYISAMGPISQEIITYIKITAIFVTVQVNSAVAILTVFIYKIDHFFPLVWQSGNTCSTPFMHDVY